MNLKGIAAKLSLAEKVAQLLPMGPADWAGKWDWKYAKRALKRGIGQVTLALRWVRPREAAERANMVQEYLVRNTRPGLPGIMHEECLHGLLADGCTVFPQAIGLSSTWDPALVERVAKAIGREARARGVNHALSPTINIARDVRAGRTDETYGEDPLLTSRFAVAFVRGIQSQGVAATVKHFATNFVGDGGRDSHATHMSERVLRETYFPAFEASIREAGARSVMAAYNTMDGTPASASRWLLTDVLRGEWGFDGVVVSDYDSVRHIHEKHRVAPDFGEAGALALEAGLDQELPTPVCFPHLTRLVRSGRVSVRSIDRALERVLRLKEWAGLFGDWRVSPANAAAVSDCREHRILALEAARRTLVLLKNSGVLPFGDRVRRIAVVGPSADKVRLGSYSGWGVRMVSPLEGIRLRAGAHGEVVHEKGCDLKDLSTRDIEKAVRAARKADVAVVVAGNNAGWGDDANTEGESGDRSDIRLPGAQEELIRRVCEAAKKAVVVLTNGSAIAMEGWADLPDAILECWYPGEEGGTAIAEALFGDFNPGGKLTLTFPRRTGQLPLYYNARPSGRVDDYIDLRGTQPQYAFGHGLSYTKFEYGKLSARRLKGSGGPSFSVSLDIRNAGRRAGDEVVQLYVKDEYASVARPAMELKGFRRISLAPGERSRVEFTLGREGFEFLGPNLRKVVEPGGFEVMVGSSSVDVRGRVKVQV